MPTWLIIVIAVVLLLIVLLAIGGAVAIRRRRDDAAGFAAQIDEANRALAAAHAEDKGWEPVALADAARRVFDEHRPGPGVRDLTLVQVQDRPGIEDDRAVFRVIDGAGGEHELVLARHGDSWIFSSATP